MCLCWIKVLIFKNKLSLATYHRVTRGLVYETLHRFHPKSARMHKNSILFQFYVKLFHLNGNENNLFIAIKVQLLNLHIGAWEKIIILEENWIRHLEAFASELLIYPNYKE